MTPGRLFGLFAALSILAFFSPPAAAEGEPSYVVDAAWLIARLQEPDLVILDARGPKAHKKGHIPGALAVKWQDFAVTAGRPGSAKWGVAFHARDLSARFAALGIHGNRTVVVYGDPLGGWGEEGRFVWMLRSLAVEGSYFLDGGFPYWKVRGLPVSREKVSPDPVPFHVEEEVPGFSVDTEWVRSRLGQIRIIDSRTEGEYWGQRKHGEARGGHLPGAILVPYLSLFQQDGRLLAKGDLKDLFTRAGIRKEDDIVVYCTAGIRSAYMVLVLRMNGYSRAANYDQSFYRWAADKSLPLEGGGN